MKALALVTHTLNCEAFWRSFECLGHEVHVERYDNRTLEQHEQLIDTAKSIKAELIIYIGAIQACHGLPVPSPQTLKRLNDVAPMIHICGDGCDVAWWPLLREYDEHQCFSVQVSIDGNPNTPIVTFNNGMLKLTPVDPRIYSAKPWHERQCFFGNTCNGGHGERASVLTTLSEMGMRHPGHGCSYADLGRFMSDCKVIANTPINGTGNDDHVKGRVIEVGFAGACLLERRNKETARWFRPGEDYLDYADCNEALSQAHWAHTHEDEVRVIAERFNARVNAEHHPRVFWHDVLAKAGVIW